MLNDYRDITRRLGNPLWYDPQGVPRYDPFEPRLLGVYIQFAALLSVECQYCRRRFQCAVEAVPREWCPVCMDFHPAPILPTTVQTGFCSWGDPPPHDCAGDTMGADVLGVLQFWRRDGKTLEWRRDPTHEVAWIGD